MVTDAAGKVVLHRAPSGPRPRWPRRPPDVPRRPLGFISHAPGYHAAPCRSSPTSSGIGLAGGQGVRARPLTLKAPGYLRSKAAMSFLGRRLIRWVLQILSSEGIKEYYIIAHGKENRYQIKVMIGYGEGFGVDVKYSPVKYDALSTGSADSALRMIEHWDIAQRALVFPTDSIIDFDLEPMLGRTSSTGPWSRSPP